MKTILIFIFTVSVLFGTEDPPLKIGGGCHSYSPDNKWYVSITDWRDGTPVRIAIWDLSNAPLKSLYFIKKEIPEFEARIPQAIQPRSGSVGFEWNEDSTHLTVYFDCHRTKPPTKKEFHYDLASKNFMVRDSKTKQAEQGGAINSEAAASPR